MPGAPAKSEDKRRQLVWFARCGADRCPYSLRNGAFLSTNEAARRHSVRKPGHNVIVSFDTPEGRTFYTVYLNNETEIDYTAEEPPF